MKAIVVMIVCAGATAAAQAPGPHRLAVGSHHACSITANGTVTCWGKNALEQLGDGTRDDRGYAVPVKGVASAIEVVAGSTHACALVKDGSVWCWGGNASGQTGDVLDAHHGPRRVQGLPAASRIFAGPVSTCALGRDDKLRCWGQSPLLATGPSATPVEVAGATKVTAIAFVQYGNAVCVATPSGIDCSGSNIPTHIAIANVTRLASGPGRLVALTKNGAQHRFEFEMGKKSAKRSSVSGPGTVTELAGTEQGTCAVDRRGQVACASAANYNVPFAKVPADPKAAVDVGVGDSFACALRKDGSHRCWGNGSVELGDAQPVRQAVKPGRAPPSVSPGCDVSTLSVPTIAIDACPRKGTCEWTEVPGTQLDLALTGSDITVALLQRVGECRQLRVAKFGSDLVRSSLSQPFGPGDASSVLVAAAGTGVLVATTSGTSTALYQVASNGKVSGPTAIVRGRAATLVEGPPGGPALLVVYTGGDHQRDNGRVAVEAVLVDAQGHAGTAVPVFGLQGFEYNSSPSGVWVGDAFVLAREQEAPASPNRVAVARIAKDGKVTSRAWLDNAAGLTPSVTWDGKQARVYTRQYAAGKMATCTSAVDTSGRPSGTTCVPDQLQYALLGVAAGSKASYVMLQNRGYAGPWLVPFEIQRIGPDGTLTPFDTVRSTLPTSTQRAPETAAWRMQGDTLVLGWLAPAGRTSEPPSLWLSRMGGP